MSVRSFVCPFVRPPPQALSGLKSALSGQKSTLSGLKSALSGLESALSGLKSALSGLKSALSGLKSALSGLVSENESPLCSTGLRPLQGRCPKSDERSQYCCGWVGRGF